jgi:hypothetical protein
MLSGRSSAIVRGWTVKITTHAGKSIREEIQKETALAKRPARNQVLRVMLRILKCETSD